jgi:hypothetical protein
MLEDTWAEKNIDKFLSTAWDIQPVWSRLVRRFWRQIAAYHD